MGSRMLGISHLEDENFFSSWKKKRPLLLLITSECVWSPMKHNLFYTPSSYKIGRDLLHELHSLSQKKDTTGSTSFSAFLRTALPANETTTASMKLMFFDTMRFHEHDPHNKMKKW